MTRFTMRDDAPEDEQEPSAEPAQLPIEPLSVRISAAVRLTGIGRSTLYELIKLGKIDTVKIGRSTLIPWPSLRRLIDKGVE